MLDSETFIRHPHEEHGDGRTSITMRDEGVEIVLFFADLSGEGEVLEVRVLPGSDPISPQVMTRIGTRFALYAQYARAALRWETESVRSTLASLRSLGRTSRGLPPDHYIQVARFYDALVAEGARHPVKALAEALHTDISNASRWRKECIRRGLIDTTLSTPARSQALPVDL